MILRELYEVCVVFTTCFIFTANCVSQIENWKNQSSYVRRCFFTIDVILRSLVKGILYGLIWPISCFYLGYDYSRNNLFRHIQLPINGWIG
jgi:hypothetical protein